ncbi:MAG: molybdopterin-binding protein, partial [Kofleriaceae bacterium]
WVRMEAVATLRVHIAELVIATNPAAADVTIADSISDRAEAKGLIVRERAIVADVEREIRAVLERFIGDPDIDVVIATSIAESAAASDALRPLVTQPVPGFTDLFRWLAYQEIGASAMLSNAEAAQCTSTFVFVLPAVKGAVIEAMDKLILPQLDPATTPKNLIQQIPRLASLVTEARAKAPPTVETPRPQGVPSAVEPEKTEAGYGISARLPAARPANKTGPHVIRKEPVPDVTRQIDRRELERTIRKGEQNDAVTKPAIDIRNMLPRVPPGADDDADDVGDDTDFTGIGPPQPLARVKLMPKEAPAQRPGTRKPPTIQIPALPGKPVAAKPPEKLAEKPAEKVVEKPVAKPADKVPPALQRKTPPAGEVVSIAELAREIQTTELDPSELEEMPTKPAPKVELDDEAPTTHARARPITQPPPPPKKRAITEPPPIPETGPVLKVPDKKAPPPRERVPTEPPRPRDSLNDLPQGKFVYPVQTGTTGKTIAKFLVAALVAAAAGIAFVHFFLQKDDKHQVATILDAPRVAEVVAQVVADAAVIAEAEPDAAIPEFEIDVPATRHPTGGHVVTPRPHHEPGGAGSGSATVAAAGSAATPPEDPSCDEVSCVLEKYARPCCARYKPADSGFKPSVAGQNEALDKVQVRTGIEGVKPRVIACGEKNAARGTVKIAMTVSPEGVVKQATVEDAPAPELGACVAQALKSASFAKTAKGGSFVYPFVF